MAWLEHTPIAVIEAHLEMLDRIRAEESLEGVGVTLVGTATGKPGGRRSLMNKWQRAARPRRARRIGATPGVLQAMGISVTVVPKKAAATSEVKP